MSVMNLLPETQIKLNKFHPRPYQRNLCRVFEEGKFKRFLIIWPRRCLSGDSHIIMANGSYKLLRDINQGDSILSWDGKRFLTDRVKHKWSTGIKKTKSLKGFGYLPIITSEDHQFATTTCSSKKYSWNKVSDISKYKLCLNYAGINLGSKNNPDLAEFLGYMLSDGYVSGYQQPKFTNTNIDILKRVEYLAQKLFDITVLWREKGNGFDLGFSNGTKGGGSTSNPIKELFRDDQQDVPKAKRRLLNLIWDFDEASLGRFLSAFISGDGNIYSHKEGFVSPNRDRIIPPAHEITLNCGVSELMAWDIYWLLRKMSIVPQVPYKERGSNWKVKISKGHCVRRLLSYGPIYGKEQAQSNCLSKLTSYRENKITDGCFRSLVKIKDNPEEELFDIETEQHHNFIANGYVVHNSGKDICAVALLVRAALKRIGTYFYVFPEFSSGRRILWDGIDIDGHRILHKYIPEEIVESRNEQQMRIRLINGSQIVVLGSDNFDSTIIGTNAVGMIFSEYALQDSRAWSYAIPILNASNGWALFISTPRGKNHLWELYNVASTTPGWFCEKLTIDDTQHVPIEEIQKEIESGQMSQDLAMQEWWTSFELGVEGSFYSKYIDNLRHKTQITSVPWEPYHPVHTAWDLGFNDPTTIIFFQQIGAVIRIIDCYENTKKGLDHYAKVVKEKPYTYGKHIAPHDIAVHDLGTGISRWKTMHDLGITFIRYDTKQPNIEDGIEAVRRNLPKMWFDERACEPLLKALENYRQEYDVKRKVYKTNPLHDWSSHWADAMRYLCVGLSKISNVSSPEALERRYNEAIGGTSLPGFFRDDLPNY